MAALLLGASLLWSCGGNDRTDVGGVSGSGGQVGVAGSGTGGGAGAPNGGDGSGPGRGTGGGTGGSAGGGSGEPTVCLAPTDPFAWPTPRTFEVPASESWKADLELPNDPFLSQATGFDDPRWIKFIALASEPGKIYFQNSSLAELAFHYEFARDFIPEFSGMTRAQFDAVTLENEGRRAVLGAVLVPADSAPPPRIRGATGEQRRPPPGAGGDADAERGRTRHGAGRHCEPTTFRAARRRPVWRASWPILRSAGSTWPASTAG